MFSPTYRLTKHLSACLERTTLLSGALKSLSSGSPVRLKVTRDALGRDAHSSTWIEGNTLSLAQVSALVDGKDIAAESRQKTEVKNCIAVLRWIMSHQKSPCTTARILTLHAQMTKGLLPAERSGCWRKVQNYVVNAKQQVVFTPPLPKDVVKRTGELLAWLLKSKQEHPIIRSAIFHHELVAIHPFIDGNGRMARALAQWILLQGGYDPAHSLGLDEYFAADRAKYYQMIQETHDMDRDYTHWIEYVALGLQTSMENLAERLRSVKTDGREWTPKQRELLDLLTQRGVLGSGDICQAMKVHRARVHQLIAPLIAAGVVAKKGHTRSARYQIV
ncbi:MAG: Fic family protein [Candidatus Omnitrophota bacterium]